MDRSRPSRTALRVALRRAAHQIYDAPPLVLVDPIAIPMLGPYADQLQRTPGRNPAHKPRPHSIGLRAFLVARSRYAEDLLAQAVARGLSQYVLLGAGFDTFAHRNPFPLLRVFEVDHPSTQQWKRDLLGASNLPSPARLAYAPVDFERHSLAAQLRAAGFDSSAPSFFAWLGVVPYLTREAFRATLAFIASQPHGSGVVFDYSQPRAALSPNEQLARDSLASRVHLAGEPFHLFFTPTEIAAELAASPTLEDLGSHELSGFSNIEDMNSAGLIGFRNIEDLGAQEINARYFAARTDALKLHTTAARLLSAWL